MDLRLTFDEDPINYDKWRPTYVKEMFDDIISYSELNNSKSALEIGIGTGQATLPFLKTGCSVTAVELGKNMAEFVEKKFSEYSNFKVINTSFESFAVQNNSCDIIYSATAFHWIPQDMGLPKVYSLLKPGGTLAVFRNYPYVNRENDELHRRIRKIYAKYRPTSKKITEFDGSTCRQYADTLSSYGFKDVETRLYRDTRNLDAHGYICLLNTYSDHRALKSDVKRGLESEVAEAIEMYGGKINIYDTIDLYLARKSI